MAKRPMIAVRPAEPADVAFLARVSLAANEPRLSQHPGWDATQFLAGFTEATVDEVAGRVQDSITYVVETAGEAVGRLRVVRAGQELHVAGLQILPAHQGRGIGTRVIQRLAGEAKRAGLPLTLEVEKDNPDAKRLYLRLGFEVIEEHGEREYLALR